MEGTYTSTPPRRRPVNAGYSGQPIPSIQVVQPPNAAQASASHRMNPIDSIMAPQRAKSLSRAIPKVPPHQGELNVKRQASLQAPAPRSQMGPRGGSLRVHTGAAAESSLHGERRRPEKRKIIGNYVLGKTIGAGSMGKVKVAHHMKDGEQYAIKIVPRLHPNAPRPNVSPQEAEKIAITERSKEIRTIREAALATLLRHPYICEARDVYATANHYYMVFEFVDGGQMLDYIISHGKLKEKQARKFIRQIGSALSYLHHNSIVHRDLKIENILISKTGDIKIIDFGLSNLYSRQSRLKTFCGSLYFAAPELLNAQPYIGPEVDIWSFGVVLYVLVCGKVPFDDQNMPALHAKIKRGAVEYPTWISTECKSVLSSMLVTDPNKRATLDEVLNHPWMVRGYDGPPCSYLPERHILTLPLDPTVVREMSGFDFGPADVIMRDLTRLVGSDAYQSLAKYDLYSSATSPEKKRSFFEFKIRHASHDIENPTLSSTNTTHDVLDAYHPLISIYYLVLERRQHDRGVSWQNIHSPKNSSNTPSSSSPSGTGFPPMHSLHPTPEAKEIVTNSDPTSELVRATSKLTISNPIPLSVGQQQQFSRETTGSVTPPLEKTEKKSGGLFRRFSSRRKKSKQSLISVSSTGTDGSNTEIPSPTSVAAQRIKIGSASKPPVSALNKYYKTAAIGRSTSVNESQYRQAKMERQRNETQVNASAPVTANNNYLSPPTTNTRAQLLNSRGRSVGHMQGSEYAEKRRARILNETMGIPAGATSGIEQTKPEEKIEPIKPVFLKGLFSVSTTSTKSTEFIQRDLIRVLRLLNIKFSEIKGGYLCIYNENSAVSSPSTKSGQLAPPDVTQEASLDFIPDAAPVDDMSPRGSKDVCFEVYIVKIPILSLRGVSFHRISGDSWTYKNLASLILNKLRL